MIRSAQARARAGAAPHVRRHCASLRARCRSGARTWRGRWWSGLRQLARTPSRPSASSAGSTTARSRTLGCTAPRSNRWSMAAIRTRVTEGKIAALLFHKPYDRRSAGVEAGEQALIDRNAA